jgi:hypothetical protein
LKDAKYIALFVVLGLILAYVTSGPLRKKPGTEPQVGTPLQAPLKPMAAATAQSATENERVYVTGTINVAASLPSTITKRVLFLIVRSPAGGPPVAVKRVESPTFPLTFALSPANNMVGTDFFEGNLVLVARLDADGGAGPKTPDDIEVTTPVASDGDRRVALTITN